MINISGCRQTETRRILRARRRRVACELCVSDRRVLRKLIDIRQSINILDHQQTLDR